MKGSRIFIICITAMVIILFMVQLQMPKQFSWKPTFAHKDRNPFGCYVVDSILSHTMPMGYTVNAKSLYELSQSDRRQGVLIVSNQLELTETDYKSVKNILKRGGKVMIIGEEHYYGDLDSIMIEHFGICFSGNSRVFSLKGMKQKIENQSTDLQDTISWNDRDGIYPGRKYSVYNSLMGNSILTDTVKQIDYIAYYNEWSEAGGENGYGGNRWISKSSLLAARHKIGRGEVILVACPLVFTNYGMITANTAEYIHRLMTLMKDVPVTRTVTYMSTEETAMTERSPLRYFLGQPPLRWALCLTLLTILIFMVFTARRRQRIIPVVKGPQNKSLEFIQLIGTLYFHKHDNTDLVRKKFIFFSEEIRRRLMVDVQDTNDNDHTFTILSRTTGMTYEDIATIIKDLRIVYYHEGNITSKEMRQYVDNMNKILMTS